MWEPSKESVTPASTIQNRNLSEYYYIYDYIYLNDTETGNATDTDNLLLLAYNIGDFLTHYYLPAVVLVGGIGNILSVIVFYKTKLKKLSSSYYLAALGISDTCFLICAFVSWLNYININIFNKNYFCQFFTFTSGLCSFLSVYFVVAFTVERFIAVLYPLKRQTMCTVKRACTVLIGLFFLGCIISIPCLVYAAPQYSVDAKDFVCDVREEYKVSFSMLIVNFIVYNGVCEKIQMKLPNTIKKFFKFFENSFNIAARKLELIRSETRKIIIMT